MSVELGHPTAGLRSGEAERPQRQPETPHQELSPHKGPAAFVFGRDLRSVLLFMSELGNLPARAHQPAWLKLVCSLLLASQGETNRGLPEIPLLPRSRR